MRIFFLAVICAVLFISCKKEIKEMQPLDMIATGQSVRLNHIHVMNDSTWIVCGGIRNEKGIILKTANHGITWNLFHAEFPKSIYTLSFIDEQNGFAGGDFLHMWRTSDGGDTWNFYWLGIQVPFNGEDRPAIRDFALMDSSNWYFCGGENMGEGVLYETHDAGATWNFKTLLNEMRCMENDEDLHLFSAGHGTILKIDSTLSHTFPTAFDNDFIMSSCPSGNGGHYLCSSDGKVYYTPDLCTTLNEKMDAGHLFQKRISWNAITCQNEKIVVCGNDGMIAESNDEGATWHLSQLAGEPHLFSIAIAGDEWWTTSDNGTLYRIK